LETRCSIFIKLAAIRKPAKEPNSPFENINSVPKQSKIIPFSTACHSDENSKRYDTFWDPPSPYNTIMNGHHQQQPQQLQTATNPTAKKNHH